MRASATFSEPSRRKMRTLWKLRKIAKKGRKREIIREIEKIVQKKGGNV